MLKYLLLILLALFAWWWLTRPRQRPPQPPAERPPESMVVCAHCGVHQPRSESISVDGRHYCCEAHRRAAGGN